MDYYDDLETRDPSEREAALFAALPEHLDHARRLAPAVQERLAGVDVAGIRSRASLAALPLTRKSDLLEMQRRRPPFGGLATVGTGEAGHVFGSPGPIYELDGGRADSARFARALFAAGFRSGDLVYNTFSYHFTPAGIMVDSGARALGCSVFPAGVGQTELQVAAIAHLRPNGYVGTPSFLKILLDRMAEAGVPPTFGHALVSGEALPGALRSRFEEQGVRAAQCYTTADLGVVAYESASREGLIVSEGLILEIVRPGTGDPVAEGEVGEVVVTPLDTPEYPLLRLATGDLSAVLPGVSPCGRTNLRIRGWLGRADQSAKVRGMFVHPGQVAEIVRRHREVLRARLVLDRKSDADVMTFKCETAEASEALARSIEESIRDVCNLRGEVELQPPGALPNDGKVIEDVRPHD